jgi:hypothetical protein
MPVNDQCWLCCDVDIHNRAGGFDMRETATTIVTLLQSRG